MIEFHRRALEELRQAVAWYRDKSPQVAERFIQRTELATERVMADPTSHTKLGHECRYVPISRFPFLIVYRVLSNGDVFVVAVAHTSRRRGYWRNRK